MRVMASRERDSLAAVDTGECLAAHSAVSLRAADGCIPRMMRKRAGASRTSGAALLLSSGIRLLVRHAKGQWRLAAAYARSDRLTLSALGGAGARRALPQGCALKGETGAGMHHRRAPGVDGGDDLL